MIWTNHMFVQSLIDMISYNTLHLLNGNIWNYMYNINNISNFIQLIYYTNMYNEGISKYYSMDHCDLWGFLVNSNSVRSKLI